MRVVVIVCLLSGTAAAGPAGDIPLDDFHPAVDSRGFVTVDGAAVLDAGQPSIGLVTSVAKDMLAQETGVGRAVIDDVISPTLVGAVGVGRRGEFGLALPLGVISSPGVDTQGVGDLALDAKLHLGALGPIGFAAIASASLPTGTKDAWLSAGRAAVGARLVAEATLGPVRVAVNGGLRTPLGGDETYMDPTGMTTSIGPAAQVGGAVAWGVVPGKIELVAEGYALVALRGQGYAPVEALGAARFYLARSSHLELGAGTGLGATGGNPELRGFIGIVFEPTSPHYEGGHSELIAEADPPPQPPAPPAPVVDDGSGDRDHDGIPDKDDLCPDEPEDYNGVEDADGCPDADFHHDTVVDHEDRCDRDSCPDRDIVRMGDAGLIVLEDINFEFDSAVIAKDSYRVLDAVVDTLQANPDVTSVEIGGHTDERGADLYNLALSKRRAASVLAYLAAHGVDGSRLSSEGYGKRVPKVQGHDEHAWRINRRVEFVILHRNSGTK